MHPVFFEFNVPEFLQGFLPDTITIYSYGFFIALGAILGFIYTAYQAKKQFNTPIETIQMLIILIIIAAVVGGKFFMIFEDPQRYLSDPSRLLKNFSSGFVFYGSLIFAIPTILLFFRSHKLPTLAMLDIMAATACIVHASGRIGCFMAGCCYGTPHDGLFSVTFSDPKCVAEPLNTPLHPTQLYSSITIFAILVVIIFMSRRKQFNGQLFMLYLMLYAIARSILEVFRGDLERGFLIDNVLSNSQFISI
ncbi:MAG: prolipoprotein diacylglyceryl transferase, partial [Cyclobacteriaceae bacterium]|nr:prolipoprotein diacylglyceryl transferase [Cyclobacteriaceae bacterium]